MSTDEVSLIAIAWIWRITRGPTGPKFNTFHAVYPRVMCLNISSTTYPVTPELHRPYHLEIDELPECSCLNQLQP